MAGQDGMVATTMRKHANDGTGHCRLCTAGAQTGCYAWPCQIYLAAEEAAASMTGSAALQGLMPGVSGNKICCIAFASDRSADAGESGGGDD
jgi:hypothetical protein